MARVLVVEDTPNILRLMSTLLHQKQYEVVTATNGIEALDILEGDGVFDGIIADIKMPEMDGLELLDYLNRKYPSIPVLICSAHVEPSLEAVRRGARGFLRKPFTRDTFFSEVHRLLSD